MKAAPWQGSVSAHRHSSCQRNAGSRAQSCGGPFDGRSVRTGWHLQFLKAVKRWGRHLDPSLFYGSRAATSESLIHCQSGSADATGACPRRNNRQRRRG